MRHSRLGRSLVRENPIHPIHRHLLEGETVHLDKGAVAAALRRQGDHDRAQRAECTLPRRVDTKRDAGLLHQLDVDIRAMEAEGRPSD